MTLDFGTMAQWGSVVAAVVMLAFNVHTSLTRARREDVKELWTAFNRLTADNASLSARLANAEGQLKHLPTAESFASLRETVAQSNGEFVGLRAEVRAIGKSIERMDNLVAQLVENELAGGRDAKRQTVERTPA